MPFSRTTRPARLEPAPVVVGVAVGSTAEVVAVWEAVGEGLAATEVFAGVTDAGTNVDISVAVRVTVGAAEGLLDPPQAASSPPSRSGSANMLHRDDERLGRCDILELLPPS